jgi:hypothetical protein
MEEIMKDKITNGEKYNPAMKITDQAEADRYFNECVEHCMRCLPTDDRAEAECIEKSNLGYWAGYYDDKTRRRVEKLFRCSHPIFGSVEQNGPPTPQQALKTSWIFR